MRLVFEATYRVPHGTFVVMQRHRASRYADIFDIAYTLYDDARHYDGECESVRFKSLECWGGRWYDIALDLLRPYEGE